MYSLAGIPNDVQPELYWGLCTTKREPNGVRPHRQLKKMTVGFRCGSNISLHLVIISFSGSNDTGLNDKKSLLISCK
ncbi:hypothetical protein CEXT_740841 [Caerostris extrusa]|uniref:Uncharacterized protein n=1 Tax=Caerostris extrusa TaxID=172846 RepID=A0AAV4XGH8_CAEEX|nr:hypothetical protein CEXT_740841 [Caerostris extrusa]